MHLIIGLGNPGDKYKDTRHNIGFRVVALWSRGLGVRLTGRRFQSRSIRTMFRDREVVLLRPLTYMNRSGTPVRACADFFGLGHGNILVIHDDLDLPVGRIKVVKHGGSGGHKGVASIIEHMGGTQFPRIKLGIGRPRHGETIEDFVLAPFYSDEKSIMKRVTRMAVHACELFISEGVEPAMSQINCHNLANKEERN